MKANRWGNIVVCKNCGPREMDQYSIIARCYDCDSLVEVVAEIDYLRELAVKNKVRIQELESQLNSFLVGGPKETIDKLKARIKELENG